MLLDKYLFDLTITEDIKPAPAIMKVLFCYNSEDEVETTFFTVPTETTFLCAGVEKDMSQIRKCTQYTKTSTHWGYYRWQDAMVNGDFRFSVDSHPNNFTRRVSVSKFCSSYHNISEQAFTTKFHNLTSVCNSIAASLHDAILSQVIPRSKPVTAHNGDNNTFHLELL